MSLRKRPEYGMDSVIGPVAVQVPVGTIGSDELAKPETIIVINASTTLPDRREATITDLWQRIATIEDEAAAKVGPMEAEIAALRAGRAATDARLAEIPKTREALVAGHDRAIKSLEDHLEDARSVVSRLLREIQGEKANFTDDSFRLRDEESGLLINIHPSLMRQRELESAVAKIRARAGERAAPLRRALERKAKQVVS